MCEAINSTQSVADYLAQLLKDRKQLAAFPHLFLHVERVMDEEIIRVRSSLFHINGMSKQPLELPDSDGSTAVSLSEKVYVPVKEYPDFNFVGRILGPRGMTAKQLEQETGCKIMVRGRGSMRDRKKEEQNRGKPNWEHLNDDLHVLITVEDAENRAHIKLQRAVEEINNLLVPAPDGEDELKKRQLMELAIINGTYRDSTIEQSQPARIMTPTLPPSAVPNLANLISASQVRTSVTLGAPLIFSAARMAAAAQIMNPAVTQAPPPPPLISAADAGLLYASPYAAGEYFAAQLVAQQHPPPGATAAAAAATAHLLGAADFTTAVGGVPGAPDPTGGAGGGKQLQQRVLGQSRDHPYRRAGGALC